MNDPLFSSFFVPEPAPAAPVQATDAGKKAGGKAVGAGSTSLPQSAQSLIVKLNGVFSEHDDASLSAMIAALESTVEGRSVVLHLSPEITDASRAFVYAFVEKVMRVGETLEVRRQEGAIAKLAEVMIPDAMGEARGVFVADNLKLRDEFLAKVPCLKSKDIGRSVGHSASNLHATAARWKRSNEIFSVHHRGIDYFPAFQFGDDGRPHPTIKMALAALPASLSPWQRAFWFVSTNGWLNDAAPADNLDDPKAVISAAQRESQKVVG